MVIPFLSLYLTQDKGFSLGQVGWIMTAFGLGSVIGAYIGGYLTDKVSAFAAMVVSLGSSGLAYILTQFSNDFWSICFMIFLVVMLADIFRPASFVALRSFTNQQNQTRSTSLIRLAINLGFSVGPALGGLLIYNLGYASLFWVDGLTSIASMFLLLFVLHPSRSKKGTDEESLASTHVSAYKDSTYMLFILGMVLLAFAFLQYFSTLPYYFSKGYALSEKYIGILLGFNGLLVFLIEMPLVHYLESKGRRPEIYLVTGGLLLLMSFGVLLIGHHVSLLWSAMVLMSLSEVLAFPFANSFALDRSRRGRTGQYMALYTIAFSIAHIFAHNAGFQLIRSLGFDFTWWIMVGVCLLMSAIFLALKTKD
jgi:predicted MFS family arabinose efflux permease